jgi:hypothetical protein
MTLRTDLLTARQNELALILLPAISWIEASSTLALSGMQAEVAAYD